MGLAVLFAGFVCMVLVNPTAAFDEVLGWRGFILGTTCLAMVYAASKMSVSGSLAKLAGNLGNTTYGLCLFHPVVFFGLVQIILPRAGITNPSEWALYARLIWLPSDWPGILAYAA